MNLTKKMAYGVLSLQLVIFIGIYLISLNNERNYFIQQTDHNVKDMAVSLGLLLSHTNLVEDKAKILPLVESVFSRGYFSVVEIRDPSGSILAARYLSKPRRRVAPQWFVNLIKWPPAIDRAKAMKSNKPIAEIFVTSDNNYAFKALWRNAILLSSWYLLFAFLSLLSAYLFIQWLLIPLKRIAEQAFAICKRKFPIETTIPRTLELKHLTLAMNQMVGRIKRLFEEQSQQIEELRKQTFQDNLTGLGNRRYFLQQLGSLLANEEEFTPGFMLLVSIDELNTLNKKQGFQQGDLVIEEVAKTCVNFWSAHEIISLARVSGGNFALLIKESNLELFIKKTSEFNQILQGLFYNNAICKVFLAVTAYALHQASEVLFNEVEHLLKNARTEPDHMAYSPNLDISSRLLINGDSIIRALSELRLSLCSQWVVGNVEPFHQEIFVRINEGNQQLSAGYFMPMAEKAGVVHLIDQFVLAKISIRGDLDYTKIALNLADETVLNRDYQANYLAKLENLPLNVRNNLYIELKEEMVLKHFVKVSLFVKKLRNLHIKMGIDQVGIHFLPMHYLSELPVSYLKLHGSLIQDISENQHKQFFIHYFSKMSKILDVQLIATQIETERQWKLLQELDIKWGQGQCLSPVEMLN